MKAPTMEFLSKADVVDIDESTKAVLENVGLLVNHAEARELFKKAGCEVDEKTKVVKIPESLVVEAMSSTPTNYKYYSRDGKHDCTLVGDGSKTLFAPLGIATNVTDYVSPGVFKKRPSTLKDIQNMSTIVDACPNIDHMIQGVSAMDLMLAKDKNRHVREFDATMVGTSKTFLWDTHAEDLADCVKIQTAVCNGLRGRRHRELGKTVNPPQFLSVNTVFRRIKILNRAGKFSLEAGGVERCYQFCTAHPLVQIGEILLNRITQRVDRAETRNDYSPQTHAQVI